MEFRELDVVRVVRVDSEQAQPDGFSDEWRAPRLGDTGTVVHRHAHVAGLPPAYMVESVRDDGETIWLTTFCEDQFELGFFRGR
jgi:hypothetical protein